MGNWRTERLSALPNVTQEVYAEGRFWTQVSQVPTAVLTTRLFFLSDKDKGSVGQLLKSS